MELRTEAEIMKTWHATAPLVSIASITYNQERYIRDAFNGFLMQETDFPFEIIIHDDASTDATPLIIKEYVARYPKLIKPIFQKENQHSLGRKVQMISIMAAQGKYIALCDADDYWTDPKKLQKQVAAMQRHPQCYMSFHPVKALQVRGNEVEEFIMQQGDQEKIFTPQEVILGDGGFCPTVSLMFVREVFADMPDWFYSAPVGDYFMQILGALHGGALYMNEVMAVYRCNVHGSWSSQMHRPDFLLRWHQQLIQAVDAIDQHTQKNYAREFQMMRKKFNFWMIKNKDISLKKRQEIFKNNRHALRLKDKIMWYALYQYPRFYALCLRLFK
jgi:glycosyltransferase involved in cell wall biosynthesis